MRFSSKENRIRFDNATNLDRKSGVRGPKMMGEALERFCNIDEQIQAGQGKAIETYHSRPAYAEANVGHPSSSFDFSVIFPLRCCLFCLRSFQVCQVGETESVA
jgi:hypothetical protein